MCPDRSTGRPRAAPFAASREGRVWSTRLPTQPHPRSSAGAAMAGATAGFTPTSPRGANMRYGSKTGNVDLAASAGRMRPSRKFAA